MPDVEQTVFVKIDDFEKILAKISILNQHLKKAKEKLSTIKELKANEESNIADWEDEIKAMEEKVEFITHTMSKRE